MKWNNKIGLWWIILLNSMFSLEFKHDSASSLNSDQYEKHESRGRSYKSLGVSFNKALKTLGVMTMVHWGQVVEGQTTQTYDKIFSQLNKIFTSGNINTVTQTLSIADYNTFKTAHPDAFTYPQSVPADCKNININILDPQVGSFVGSITAGATCTTTLTPKYYTYINGATKIPCLKPMSLNDWKSIPGNRMENFDFPNNDFNTVTSCKTAGALSGVCDKINGISSAPGSDIFNGALCYPVSKTLSISDTCSVKLSGLSGGNSGLNGQFCNTYNLETQTVTNNNEVIKFFNENTADLKLTANQKYINYFGIINNQTLKVNTKESNWIFEPNGLEGTATDKAQSYKLNFNADSVSNPLIKINNLISSLEYSKGNAIITMGSLGTNQGSRLKITKNDVFFSEQNKKVVKKHDVDILDEETQSFLQFIINGALENVYGDVVTKSITAEGLTDYFFEDLNHKILMEYLSFKFKILKDELILVNWKALLKDFRSESDILTSEAKFNYFLNFFTGKSDLSEITGNNVIITFLDKQKQISKTDLIEVINNFTNIFSNENLLFNEDIVKVFIQNPDETNFKYLNRNSCKDYKFVYNILKSVKTYSGDIDGSKKLASKQLFNLFSAGLKKLGLFVEYINILDNDLILNDKILSYAIYEMLKYEMVCSSTTDTNSILFTKRDLMDFIYENVINIFNQSNLNLILYPHKDSYLLNQDPSNFYLAKLKNNKLNVLTGAIRDDLILKNNPNSVVKGLNLPKDRLSIIFNDISPSQNLIIGKDSIKSDLITGLQNLKTALNDLNYIKKKNGVILTVLLMERVLQLTNVLITETYTESYYQNIYGVFGNKYTINYLNDGSTTGRIPLLSQFPILKNIFEIIGPLLAGCGDNVNIGFDTNDFFNSAIDNIICNLNTLDNNTVTQKGNKLFNLMSQLLMVLFPNGIDINALPEENPNFLKFIVMLRDMKVEESSTNGTSTLFTVMDNFLPVILKIDQYFNSQPHLKPYVSPVQFLYLHLNRLGQKYITDKANNVDSDYDDYLKHKKLVTELTNRNSQWLPSYLYYTPVMNVKNTLIGSDWIKNWNVLLSYLAKQVFVDNDTFLDLVFKDNILFIENKYVENNTPLSYSLNTLGDRVSGLSLYNNMSVINNNTLEIIDILGNNKKGRMLSWFDSGALNNLFDKNKDFFMGLGGVLRFGTKLTYNILIGLLPAGISNAVVTCGNALRLSAKQTLVLKTELLKTPKNQAQIDLAMKDTANVYSTIVTGCFGLDVSSIVNPMLGVLDTLSLIGKTNFKEMIVTFLKSPTEQVALDLARELDQRLLSANTYYKTMFGDNPILRGANLTTFDDLLDFFLSARRRLLGSGQTSLDINLQNRKAEQLFDSLLLNVNSKTHLYEILNSDFPKCYSDTNELVTGDYMTIPIFFFAIMISYSLVEKSKSLSPALGMLKPLYHYLTKKNYNLKINAMTDFQFLYKYAVRNNFLSFAIWDLITSGILLNYMNTQLVNNCSNYDIDRELVKTQVGLTSAYIGWNLLYLVMKHCTKNEKKELQKLLKYIDIGLNSGLIIAKTGIDITLAVQLNPLLPKLY